MAAKIRLVDGRELTVAVNGKQAVEVLKRVGDEADEEFARFNTPSRTRVWVNPQHVAAIEDRPDLD